MKLYAILFAAAALCLAEQSTTTIDGHTITINYAPPTANKPIAAAFHADADLAFKGVKVPKGDYTVYVLTDGPQWRLAVNKATGPKAATYDAKLDLGKVNMVMTKGAALPSCKIALLKTAALAAKLEVSLNDTVASAPFYLDRGANDREW